MANYSDAEAIFSAAAALRMNAVMITTPILQRNTRMNSEAL
jgi:hypothetical protein